MDIGSTLLRLSVDVGFYDVLPLRIAQHPSEDTPRLLTRALAYFWHFEEGLPR